MEDEQMSLEEREQSFYELGQTFGAMLRGFANGLNDWLTRASEQDQEETARLAEAKPIGTLGTNLPRTAEFHFTCPHCHEEIEAKWTGDPPYEGRCCCGLSYVLDTFEKIRTSSPIL